MSAAVLDASAVLAFLHQEPGAEVVADLLSAAVMSAVNLAEVAAKLSDGGMPFDSIRKVVDDLRLDIVPFGESAAMAAGVLRKETRAQGLSLGDRACLVLAQQRELPAVTADRRWKDVSIGLDIRLIR